MKEIKLKKLKLTYFKKFQNLEIEFKDNTVISGRNRAGKSTIFDAFLWLLFGKDSLGNSDFDIKTLDENENVIERVDHEVYAELEIDGAVTTLKRILRENWVKPMGQDTEILKGNDTKCFIDGIPLQVKEYQKRINDIVDENLFRLITDTSYFHSLKREDRRNILISIAGDISNDEIAKAGKFEDIAEMLRLATSDDLKKKIASEKKRIKEELEHIPIRIDEIKKNMPEAVNFSEIEEKIKQKKADVSKVDEKINDRQKSLESEINEANEKRKKVGELRLKQTDIILSAGHKARQDAAEKNKDFDNYQEILRDKQDRATRAEKRVLEKKKEIDEVNESLQSAAKQRAEFINQWREESAKVFNDEQDDSCPFCGHVFTDEERFETRSQGETEFNKLKSEKLEKINQNGLAVKEKILGYEKTISELEKELLSLKSEHEEAFKDCNTFSKTKPEKVEAEPVVKENIHEWVELEKQISAIEIKEVVNDNSDLTKERDAINEEIISLSSELNKKSLIEKSFLRIEELGKEQRVLSQALSEQEKIEYRLLQFNKLKMEEVDKRVNGKFKMVKFKLFDKTLEGNEYETCETLIGGVRYFSANNEARINGALDIINAVSEHNEIFAPVFLDNSEGIVNGIIKTKSQLIELKAVDSDFRVE